MNWLGRLKTELDKRSADEAIVVVTVARVRGSAPRELGAKMIVTKDSFSGSIGGGQLEHQCLQLAKTLLQTGGGEHQRGLRNFPLGTNCGQCCGGVVDILFETIGSELPAWIDNASETFSSGADVVRATPLIDSTELATIIFLGGSPCTNNLERRSQEMLSRRRPSQFVKVSNDDGSTTPYLLEALTRPQQQIAIFGAGHVGKALVELLANIDCQVDLIDGRAEQLVDLHLDNVRPICINDPASYTEQISPGTHCLVMTHSHALDFDICAKLLRRDDIPFCGLIGSAAKRKRFLRLFKQASLAADDIARLTCPIGIEGINGKTPEEIAISVVAQFLQRQEQAAHTNIQDSKYAAVHH